jgi:hypothetical protein
MSVPNKLERYITLGWKGFPGTNTLNILDPFVSNEENKVLLIWPLVNYIEKCFNQKLPLYFVVPTPNKLARSFLNEVI